MPAVRVRLIVKLRLGLRSIDVDLPKTPTIGETIELAGRRRCVVAKVLDAPKSSTTSHFVYATAEDATAEDASPSEESSVYYAGFARNHTVSRATRSAS